MGFPHSFPGGFIFPAKAAPAGLLVFTTPAFLHHLGRIHSPLSTTRNPWVRLQKLKPTRRGLNLILRGCDLCRTLLSFSLPAGIWNLVPPVYGIIPKPKNWRQFSRTNSSSTTPILVLAFAFPTFATLSFSFLALEIPPTGLIWVGLVIFCLTSSLPPVP